MAQFTITFANDRCMVATLGSLVVPIVGKAGYDAAAARGQAIAIEAHGRSLGRGRMVEMSIIDVEVPMPDAEVRAILDGAVPTISPYYAAVSAVYAGNGFRAALIRGILTSFQFLSRTPYPQKVFADIDQSCAFVGQRLTALSAPGNDPSTLLASVDALCEDVAARGLISAATANSRRRR